MANILKIKRGTGSSAPSSLRRGELAYAEGSKALYIGSGDETNNAAANLHIIGGALNNMVAPTGSLNMSSQKIINLAAPVSPNDAARKVDVDNEGPLNEATQIWYECKPWKTKRELRRFI